MQDSLAREWHSDPSTDLAPERRRHVRVKLDLPGRFMREDRQEFTCRLTDVSIGGAGIATDAEVRPGERIIAYIDQLGGLEGEVFRIHDGGFAFALTASRHKRERLAAQMTLLINAEEFEPDELRRAGHERFQVGNKTVPVQLASGQIIECLLADMSVSGAGLISATPPDVGATVQVGKLRGRVVRHTENGFGVQFLDVQQPSGLQRLIG